MRSEDKINDRGSPGSGDKEYHSLESTTVRRMLDRLVAGIPSTKLGGILSLVTLVKKY